MDKIYYLGYVIIAAGVSILLLHGIIKILASKVKLERKILDELQKKISELGLGTKVIVHDEKFRPIYDITNDIIEIENKHSFSLFCSAFHELGHAYFNKYCGIARYTKDGTLVKKERSDESHPYFYTSVVVLIGISAIIMFWWKIVSILISVLAALLFTSVLREEFMSSISAMNIIKASKYLTQRQEYICGLYLISLLGTYMFLFFLSISLIIYNIL